jgi:hypothetical protein
MSRRDTPKHENGRYDSGNVPIENKALSALFQGRAVAHAAQRHPETMKTAWPEVPSSFKTKSGYFHSRVSI